MVPEHRTPSSLKTLILSLLGIRALRKAARELLVPEPPGLDFRSTTSLRDALASAGPVSSSVLLHQLEDADLQAVAEKARVPTDLKRARLIEELLQAESQPALERRRPSRRPAFVAIDFETADYYRDSACSVALVRVEGDQIVERQHALIRPPRRDFVFTHLHGITWQDVAKAPSFGQVWPKLLRVLRGVDFLAAHNAPFDRSVLRACCEAAGLSMPATPFLCTVRLARQTWQLQRAALPDVCQHLRIGLQHHHAASDAEACARIVLLAAEERRASRFSYHASHPALLPG